MPSLREESDWERARQHRAVRAAWQTALQSGAPRLSWEAWRPPAGRGLVHNKHWRTPRRCCLARRSTWLAPRLTRAAKARAWSPMTLLLTKVTSIRTAARRYIRGFAAASRTPAPRRAVPGCAALGPFQQRDERTQNSAAKISGTPPLKSPQARRIFSITTIDPSPWSCLVPRPSRDRYCVLTRATFGSFDGVCNDLSSDLDHTAR